MDAFFFPSSDETPLFGVWRGASSTKRAWLLVPPFAEEEKSARRTLTEIARALNSRGESSLLFSFRGTADSAGEFAEATFELWRADLKSAFAETRRRAPDAQIAVLGVRLGASLAVLEADYWKANAVSPLVLIEPLLVGRSFLTQQMARKKMRAQLSTQSETKAQKPFVDEDKQTQTPIAFVDESNQQQTSSTFPLIDENRSNHENSTKPFVDEAISRHVNLSEPFIDENRLQQPDPRKGFVDENGSRRTNSTKPFVDENELQHAKSKTAFVDEDLDGWLLSLALRADFVGLDLREIAPFAGESHVLQVGPRAEIAANLGAFAARLDASTRAVQMPAFWNLLDYVAPTPLLDALEAIWNG